MELRRFTLLEFGGEPKSEYQIQVPPGSQYLDVIVVPSGIDAFYAIPELILPEADPQLEDFYIVGQHDLKIPMGYKFVKMCDILYQDDEQEQHNSTVFPIFKK